MSGKQSSQELEDDVLRKSKSADSATPQHEDNSGQMLSRSDMLVLQRTVGNDALMRALKPSPAKPNKTKPNTDPATLQRFPKWGRGKKGKKKGSKKQEDTGAQRGNWQVGEAQGEQQSDIQIGDARPQWQDGEAQGEQQGDIQIGGARPQWQDGEAQGEQQDDIQIGGARPQWQDGEAQGEQQGNIKIGGARPQWQNGEAQGGRQSNLKMGGARNQNHAKGKKDKYSIANLRMGVTDKQLKNVKKVDQDDMLGTGANVADQVAGLTADSFDMIGETAANADSLAPLSTGLDVGGNMITAGASFIGFVQSIRELKQAQGIEKAFSAITAGQMGVQAGVGVGQTATSGIELASDAMGATEEIAATADGVSGVLGTVGEGVNTIAALAQTVHSVMDAYHKGKAVTLDDGLEIASNVVSTIRSALSTCAEAIGVWEAMTVVLEGLQFASSALAIVGDAISIIVSAVDLVYQAIDMFRRALKVVQAKINVNRMKSDREANNEDLAVLLEQAGASEQDKRKVLHKKKMFGHEYGSEKEHTIELEKFIEQEETMLNGQRKNATVVERQQAIQELKWYLADSELIKINKKRMKRQVIPLVADSGNVAADFINIGGKTTSLIATIGGSAAFGAGAAAGLGISIGTTVTSSGLKVSGTAAQGAASLLRYTKQVARDKGVKGTNQDKTGKKKGFFRNLRVASIAKKR